MSSGTGSPSQSQPDHLALPSPIQPDYSNGRHDAEASAPILSRQNTNASQLPEEKLDTSTSPEKLLERIELLESMYYAEKARADALEARAEAAERTTRPGGGGHAGLRLAPLLLLLLTCGQARVLSGVCLSPLPSVLFVLLERPVENLLLLLLLQPITTTISYILAIL